MIFDKLSVQIDYRQNWSLHQLDKPATHSAEDKLLSADSYTPFCSGGESKVAKISYKFDEDTGEKYKVIHVDRQLYSVEGWALKASAYHIYSITKKN